ncbi:MAG: DNA repair protein RecO [Bdellovibrionales bacterium]|nr:DNA repair protein RecO [Bdellovibrionales bacterium]
MEQGKSKGIILRTNVFNESDLGVQILTSSGIKRDFIAKSALKSKKRFAGGVLEPSHYIEFSWKEASSGLTYLEEAKLLDSFEGLRKSYEKVETAMRGIQLVNKVCKEGLEQEEVFHILGNYLKLCAAINANKKTYLHFMIRLLSTIGILPNQSDFAAFQQTPLSDSDSIQLSEASLRNIENALRPYKEDYLS